VRPPLPYPIDPTVEYPAVPVPDPGRHPVEPKVKAATAAGGTAAGVLVPFVLWLLSVYVFGGDVPLPVQGAVGLAVTAVCTFAAGYYARHVERGTGH
jgi:hypothetical protein